MDCTHGEHHFTTRRVTDAKDGFAAIELLRTSLLFPERPTEYVARVIFWDAAGQFSIETFGTDIPVAIAEDLIAEAKAVTRVR